MDLVSTAPVLPAEDMSRAKAFYAEKVGLPVSSEDNGGVMFGEGTGRVFVYPAGTKSPGTFTQAGLEVSDVPGAVQELRSRGVVFEEYDMPNLKTENGIAVIDGRKGAWFKDTEGNIIGVIQAR